MQSHRTYLTGQDIHEAWCITTLNYTREWKECSPHVQAYYEEMARNLNKILGVCDPDDAFSEDAKGLTLYINDATGRLHQEVDAIVRQHFGME